MLLQVLWSASDSSCEFFWILSKSFSHFLIFSPLIKMYLGRILRTLINMNLNLFLFTLLNHSKPLTLIRHHLLSLIIANLLMSSISRSNTLQSSYVSIHSGGKDVIVRAVSSDFCSFAATNGFRTDDISYDSYFYPIIAYFENLCYAKCTATVSFSLTILSAGTVMSCSSRFLRTVFFYAWVLSSLTCYNLYSKSITLLLFIIY